jgi:PAS domain S-box-containing protein
LQWSDSARASILIVDDSPDELQQLETLLHPLGRQVIRALSSQEALEQLPRHDVACILLDVQMEGLDGFDVARLLESQARTHVPLLLLTELSRQEAHLVRSYSRGAVDYLPKPLVPEALRSRVRALVDHHVRAGGRSSRQGLSFPEEMNPQREIERQRDRLHSFLMQSPAIINIFRGPEHTFDFVNTRFLQVLGDRAFLGRTVREAQPELAGQGVYELLDRVYQTGESFRGETVPVHISPEPGAPTRERFYTFTYQPLRADDGQVQGVGSFAFDVTEQVLARQRLEAISRELRESQEQLRLILEGVQEYAIFLLTPEGQSASWSRGVERVLGYTAEEFVGRPFSVLFTEEDQRGGQPVEELVAAAETGVFKGEGPRRHKDGTLFQAEIVLQALRDEQGELRAFVKVLRDISQRKQAEEERERLLRQLQDAVRLRDEFLSIASHELKTPLTPLRLKLEGLLRAASSGDNRPPFARKDLDTMRRQVKRLAYLVNDMLEVSHPSREVPHLKREPVDLLDVVRDVVGRFEFEAEQAGCVLELSSRGNGVGDWDRTWLEQVCERLLSNALKYGAGAPVYLRVEGEAERVRLSVRDEGIGLEPEMCERIFEKFERAVSERHYGGLGLGLYFTRRIVEALGGRVTAEGAPGKGATFTVELPR